MLLLDGLHWDPLPEHDAMSVHRANRELAHAPRLVPEWLDHRPAQLVRRQRIRTLARHDDALVPREEAPPRIADRPDVLAQHVVVVAGRSVEIMDCDHVSRVANHCAVLAMERTPTPVR